MNFSEWLKQNEGIIGIYPILYSGLGAYPDGYFVNYSSKVYVNASVKAQTNPPDKRGVQGSKEKKNVSLKEKI